MCHYGEQIGPSGHHGLSCQRSAGRISCNSSINSIIAQALRSAEIPAELEPSGLLSSDLRRPDGSNLITWAHVKYLAWDFTCRDTVVSSHLSISSIAAVSMAREAHFCKSGKYAGLVQTYIFIPVVVETLGA